MLQKSTFAKCDKKKYSKKIKVNQVYLEKKNNLMKKYVI